PPRAWAAWWWWAGPPARTRTATRRATQAKPRSITMPKPPPGRRPPAGEAGATLIEVQVTTLLLALVVGALFPVLSIGQQGSDYSRRRQTMTQTGRVALDKLIRELRAAESFRTLA